MSHLRALTRLLQFLLCTFVSYRKLCRINRRYAENETIRSREQQIVFNTWSVRVCRIAHIEVDWPVAVPDAPFVFVSNHLGYMDIPVLGSRLNGRFIAKQDVSNWALFGPVVRASGTYFVHREQHKDLLRVNELISEVFQARRGIAFFPEGTSSDGSDVLPFRASLFQSICNEELPVHYGAIRYTTGDSNRPAATHVCWWGDMGFFPHLYNLFRIKHIRAHVTCGLEPLTGTDRKELAGQLHERVSKALHTMSND